MTIHDIIAAMRVSQDWSAEEIAVVAAELEQTQQRITALEAENAALRAERDEALQHRNEAVDLCAATMAQRDRVREELRVRMAAAKDELRAERDERLGATAVARKYRDELAAARQSRARLVGHVRRLRAKFSETMPDSAFVKRITDERDAAEQRTLDVMNVLHAALRDTVAERDAARAWAAAWKRAAHWWWLASRDATARGVMNAWWRKESNERRARRAAEAMERR